MFACGACYYILHTQKPFYASSFFDYYEKCFYSRNASIENEIEIQM